LDRCNRGCRPSSRPRTPRRPRTFVVRDSYSSPRLLSHVDLLPRVHVERSFDLVAVSHVDRPPRDLPFPLDQPVQLGPIEAEACRHFVDVAVPVVPVLESGADVLARRSGVCETAATARPLDRAATRLELRDLDVWALEVGGSLDADVE